MLELHREFHFGLYALTSSPWVSYLIDILWNHTVRYQRLSLPFRHDGAHAEHRRVLRALEQGDNETAAEAMRLHLEATARLVEKGYEKSATSQAAQA